MKFKINFYKIKENSCKSFYEMYMKITREYWISCKEFQVNLEDNENFDRTLHKLMWSHFNIKVCPHLYANVNECQKVVCLAFAQHCKRIFLWSTSSKQIVFGYSPNVHHTNECCSQRLGYTSASTFLSFPYASIDIRIQMWTRLYTI